MTALNIMIKGYYFLYIEVPDDWKPTPENIKALKHQAMLEADFSDGGANWEPVSATNDETNEEIPLD